MLDILSEKAEKEIVSGASTEKNLIGCCAPLLSKLCRNFSLMQKVIVIIPLKNYIYFHAIYLFADMIPISTLVS